MSGKVYPLSDPQAQAVNPSDSVWLSASAGTGKTQVLSARVLRLLLMRDVRPESILCLTFTKAGAAEMATRVNEVLARWVRMDDTELGGDLLNIGADNDPRTRAHARSLFASVLDCPGGGLRIDTIHAFSQWLLSAFPEEAGIEPGTEPMEDRDRDLLAHQVLSDLLVNWQDKGDRKSTEALEMLSLRMGADGAKSWLMRCARAREAWFGPGAWQPPMEDRVRSLLGLGADETLADVIAWCSDDIFDLAALKRVGDAYAAWGTKTGLRYVEPVESWIALSAEDRLAECADLKSALFNDAGELKYLKSILKQDEQIAGIGTDLLASLEVIAAKKALFDLVDLVTPALEIGWQYALAWEEAKQREGRIEFDDLIRRAAGLLSDPGIGDWISYKLDRRIDHVLIDEAQDTNAAQWSIVDALTGDFFTGIGQHDEKMRTIFVVGDYKQAIFRFQGTSPENFASAKQRYKEMLEVRAANAASMHADLDARPLVELDLDQSYRTAQDVLTFVDEAIGAIGAQELGLADGAEPHIGDAGRTGLVRLWNPVPAIPEDGEGGDDGAAEGWISAPERRMADRIAHQVKDWMEGGFPLLKGEKRNAGPGDVMVLVRKRRDLAGLIVARLHAAGVPVAGVDRLRLGAPLAVKDLLAALRFAAQPADSLSLASLLVSPIFGWSQQDLLDHGYRIGKISLWDHLRKSDDPLVQQSVALLLDLLALADFEPPQALIHWMLIGKWQARRKLVARLGSEANDPIDELLNAALSFAASNTPSLQGFLRWFAAGDGELKREAGEGGDQVRVMTVHGSKGLQAPIVILADATGNPHASRAGGLELEEELPGEASKTIPLPSLRKEEKAGRILAAEEAAQAEDLKEHWRLLYVAMTRAEEALFIGGALGSRENEPNADSWWARLAPLFAGQGEVDDNWKLVWQRGELARPLATAPIAAREALGELPDWVSKPIGPEPRPPRPLAPSSAGEEMGSDPPLPPEIAANAARRGVLMHSLLERLPDVSASEREQRGAAWLDKMGGDLPQHDRAEMLQKVLGVLAIPEWAELFGPQSLAEVPLAASVGDQVIAGFADRLLVEEDRVLVADYKTARRPPLSLDQLPQSTLRQMGAYAAALEVIFPGKCVEAAIIYTQTPQLIAIPGEILGANKPRLAAMQ